MSKTAIVKTGEQFFIKQLSRSQPIKLDRVIFANINGINGDTEIDLNGSMPDLSQIVHTAPVTQSGLLNDRTVVYSVILDTNVGDFSFNYIGLVNEETDTLCMVMHTDLTRKIKTAGQRQGNTITESIWLEIDNASESTGITVNAQTWQIDYSKRLAGEDERIRLTNYDLYNRLAIHSGFTITKNNNQLKVSAGLAYVAGLRVEHTAQTSIKVENNQSLYIDAWLAGSVTGEWLVNYNLIVGTNFKDYEKNGFQHYVERVASVDAGGKLVIVKPRSFVTTYDLATIKSFGIVKLNSSANSMSETEAATPRAVKTAYDVASSSVKKRGDEMTGHLRMLNSSGVKFGYENGGELAVRVINNDLEFIFYDSQTKRWTTKLRHASNDNSWRFENINDVKVNNASVANTLEHFQPLPFESVMFSPSKQYHATVRDDGVFGFFDKASQNQNLCWAVDKFGNLVHGHVHTHKIIGLERFIFDCFPPGIPLPWSQVTPPDGWFECNGSQFNVNQCPRLASVYTAGRLPDLRGEFIRGWDNTRRVDTDRVILSHQDHQIQRHSHGQNIKVYAEQGTGNPWGSGGDKFEHDYWFNTGEEGGNETRPRNVAFMYIVKAE